MKSVTNHKFASLGFGLAVLILISAGVYANINLGTLIEINNKVRYTLLVIAKIDETLALITEQ